MKIKPLIKSIFFPLSKLICFLIIIYFYFPDFHDWDDKVFGGSDSVLMLAICEQVYQNLLQNKDIFYANFFYPYEFPLSFSVLLLPFQIVYFPLRKFDYGLEASYNFSLFSAFILIIILIDSSSRKWIKSELLRNFFILVLFLNLMSANYLLGHPQLILAYTSFPLFLLFINKEIYRIWHIMFLGLIYLFLLFSFDPSTCLMVLLPILCFPRPVFLFFASRYRYKIEKLDIIYLCFAFLLIFSILFILLRYLEAAHLPSAHRSLQEIQTYATRSLSLFLKPGLSNFYKPSGLIWGEHEAIHFTGVSFFFLVLLAIFQYSKINSIRLKKVCSVMFLPIIISYLFSFGPIERNYNLIYHLLSCLPGYDSIRSIGRIYLIIFPYIVFLIFYTVSKSSNFGFKFFFYILIVVFIFENGFKSYSTEVYSKKLFEKFQDLDYFSHKELVVLKIPFEPWPSQPSNISTWMLVASKYSFRYIEGYSGFSTPERDLLENYVFRFIDEKNEKKSVNILKDINSLGINSFVVQSGFLFGNEALLRENCSQKEKGNLRFYSNCNFSND